MTCEDLRPDYASYALGIADDPERSEIAEHIARKCPVCMPGIASAMTTIGVMSGAVKDVAPPARLRSRVIAMVSPEMLSRESASPSMSLPPKRRAWAPLVIPWAMAGALAIALISIAVPGRRENADTAKLEQALSILNDPAAKDVAFGQDKPAKGRVFVSPSRGVVFIAANLPKIDRGRTFELWVIPANGKPLPAGTFDSQPDATAVYVRSGPVEANAAAVAVTVEPEGGSPQPTTTPFIVAGLT